ncbi:dipeptide/oligopeptide/nickel ABC transporter permease/ATP-binding protein [Agromyces bauzanensis]
MRSPATALLSQIWRRTSSRVFLLILLALVLIAILAPLLMPGVLTQNAGDLMQARSNPSFAHPLGTDALGRDVLQRLLVGTSVTLRGVTEAAVVALAIGFPVGLLAGYFGGWFDRLAGATADITFSMPNIVLVLVVLAVFPQNMTAAMVVFGMLISPTIMRVTRGAVLPAREQAYVDAARVSGLSEWQILGRHVLPATIGPTLVQLTLVAASAFIAQTGLAFLRLVVAAPAPSWGGMVADGLAALSIHPWLIWPPGIAITGTIVIIGLLSDSIRDGMVEQRTRGASHSRVPRKRVAAQRSPAAGPSPEALLSVRDVDLVLARGDRRIPLVTRLSFDIRPGEAVGLVGESGSGKSLSASAILGLLQEPVRMASGQVWFAGRDLTAASERELARIRGRRIALIAQEPISSLNPTIKVGAQLAEAVRRHRGLGRAEARREVLELLESVRLPDPAETVGKYPFQLSGGMAQRVGIARALAGRPELLIADEPTTALDATVQAEILDLIREKRQELGMALLLVTHDWGVIADSCDRVLTMYAGEIVETGRTETIMREPLHPYTRALLQANPHGRSFEDELPSIAGQVPAPGEWGRGCRFASRCGLTVPSCSAEPIPLYDAAAGHRSRCPTTLETEREVLLNGR